MALTDTLNSLMVNVPEAIKNIVTEQVPLAKWALQHKIGRLGGSEIKVPIMYDTPGLTAYNGTTDTYTASRTEVLTQATYTWGMYYHTEAIYKKEWLEAAVGGKNAIANLAKVKSEAMQIGVQKGLETELFATYDGTTHTLNGLPDIVTNTDPTNQASGLGNIAVADLSTWIANVMAYDSANGDLRHHMSSMVRQISNIVGKPDLIITTGDVFDEYYDEIAAKQGFLGSKIPDYGFTSVIPFQGIPVTWSENCPAGYMYFLNSKAMSLRIHPEDFIKITPWEQKSTTDPTLVSTVSLTMQMVVSARNALGVITGIS
jgi:hypothetical protein